MAKKKAVKKSKRALVSAALDAVAKGHKGAKSRALKAMDRYSVSVCKIKTVKNTGGKLAKVGKKRRAKRK